MGLKMATQQEQGNWEIMGGRGTEAREEIITRVDEIWMSRNQSPSSICWQRHRCEGETVCLNKMATKDEVGFQSLGQVSTFLKRLIYMTDLLATFGVIFKAKRFLAVFVYPTSPSSLQKVVIKISIWLQLCHF